MQQLEMHLFVDARFHLYCGREALVFRNDHSPSIFIRERESTEYDGSLATVKRLYNLGLHNGDTTKVLFCFFFYVA